jgi:hypothetical protein
MATPQIRQLPLIPFGRLSAALGVPETGLRLAMDKAGVRPVHTHARGQRLFTIAAAEALAAVVLARK